MPPGPFPSILPPPGEVHMLAANVQRVGGGEPGLSGLSWNSEGHIALSVAGEGVRLIADVGELVALARVLEAIAAELEAAQRKAAAALDEALARRDVKGHA